MRVSSPATVAATPRLLGSHPDAAASTTSGLVRFDDLFGTRAGAGIEMAARSLRGSMPPERIRAICLPWTRELGTELDDSQDR